MAPVRVAIMGTGNIAGIHATALSGLTVAAEVVAGVDVDRQQLDAFCRQHRVPAGYSDLSEMLAQARPDLVHVCTPPGLHHGQVLTCLEAGSSVLVEKPPTLSVAEMDDLVAAGGGPEAPWVATVFQHRFGSAALRLRAMADSGVLGRPLVAVCHTMWFRNQAYFDVPWRGRWDTEGGGPTMGHGIHQMDLLTAILGDWVEVSALARQQARRMETEDLSLVHITFANGAVATAVNSVVSPREESYLRFDFEHATVELTHLYGYGDDDWRVTPAPGHEDEVNAAWKAASPEVRSGHHAQFAEVLRSLQQGAPPPVTAADSRRTLLLVAGVYASAFGGGPVSPGDLEPGSPTSTRAFHAHMNGGEPRW